LFKGSAAVLSSAGTDISNQYYYWRAFGFSALLRGEAPLWNPYIFSGTPYIAGIQSAIFYPLNVLHLIFDIAFAINLGIALHCFLASFFTYIYARYLGLAPVPACLSALTFAYGAPYFFHIYAGHLSNLATMIWLPLLLLGVEAFLRHRGIKFALLGALPLALQVFAGHPQYLFYSALAAALYFVLSLAVSRDLRCGWRVYCGFAVIVLTGLSLAAVQLLPALELARNSVRETLSYEWVSAFSLPPEYLVTLIVPDFFGNIVKTPYWGKNYLWEMSVFLGIVPLATAVVAIVCDRSRPVIVFSLVALLALLLAFGKYTPLFSLFYNYVPGFNLFRGVAKFLFVFSFACAILAGFGLAKIVAFVEAGDTAVSRIGYLAIGGAVVCAAIACALWLLDPGGWRFLIASAERAQDRYVPIPALSDLFLSETVSCAILSALKSSVILFLLGCGIALAGKLPTTRLESWSGTIVALAFFDLWTFGSRYLVTFDPTQLALEKESKGFFQRDKEPFRVATPLFALLNVGMIDGIENVGGYDALVLKSYSELLNLTQNLPVDEPNIVMAINRISPLLRLLNVKYYIIDPSLNIAAPGFVPALETAKHKIYRDDKAMPRSFVVHHIIKARDGNAVLKALADPGFDPNISAVVEETIDDLSGDARLRSPRPSITARSLNKLTIDAQLSGPGLLVLSDSYFPGWKAFVNGKESPILRVNHVMRGIALPGGRYTVEFRYEPLSIVLGGLISLVTLVGVIGYMVGARVWSVGHGTVVRGNL